MTITRKDVERTYTIDEFMARPDMDEERGVQFELVNGKIVEAPLAGDEHTQIAMNMILALGPFVRQRKLGRVYPGDAMFVLDELQGIVRAPDVAFVATKHWSGRIVGAVPVPPDLAVEILSPHDFNNPGEFKRKLREYREADVLLVWVINPRTKTVDVYRVASATPFVTLTEADTLDGAEVVPGFMLSVRALFESDEP